MKSFLFLLFVSTAMFAAEIDEKLFDNADKEQYYNEVQEKIRLSSDKKSTSLIKDELLYLARLKDVASQKDVINRYDLTRLDASKIDAKVYYQVLEDAASVKSREELTYTIINKIQSKLLYLRQQIERITEEDKNKLLSYQLQFAYYKLQQKHMEKETALLVEHRKEIMPALFTSIEKVKCDIDENIQAKLTEYSKDIEETLSKITSLELQKETALIEDNAQVKAIENQLESSNLKHQRIIKRKIEVLIKEAICMIRNKNNGEFYGQMKNIELIIAQNNNNKIYQEQVNTLNEISRYKFGSTGILLSSTFEEIKTAFASFVDFFISPLFVFNERQISLFSLFKALLLVVFGFTLGVVYKKWIMRISNKWSNLSMMSVRLASNIGYYFIVLIFFIISMSSLGIDMSSVSLIAGALSIGIGFGLQTVVSNLIAGIILMFEGTIRIGDTIEISDMLHGVVTDMRIRSTTVKTLDNIDIVVPNSSFIQNNVINWTLEDRVRRLHVPFSVAYDTEVEDVKKAILEALDASSLYYVKNSQNRKTDIRMTQMNSSSVDFELYVWIEWNQNLINMSYQSDFLILIYNALRANDIKIPFPQLDVHMKNGQVNNEF